MSDKSIPSLVAEFRAIMSDDLGGMPSAEQCRAVIEFKASDLPDGPELWALWHVDNGSDVATLCEFDGSVCYECYLSESEAREAAADLNASGYSQGGRYLAARIPAGVAGNPCGSDLGSVRASGPAVAWSAGMDCGYTVCRALVADLTAPSVPQASQLPQARALVAGAVVAVLAFPASAMAAPINLALDGDPVGNAIAFMAWGCVVTVAAGFVLSACRYLSDRPSPSGRAVARLRRRVIR